MSFKYDKQSRMAVDATNRLTLKRTPGFFDDVGIYRYRLVGESFYLDFQLVPHLELRTYTYRGIERTERIEVAIFITEDSVKEGWRELRARGHSIQHDYEGLRDKIRDAVYTQFSMGGEYLQTAPDFNVAFVERRSDLPSLSVPGPGAR